MESRARPGDEWQSHSPVRSTGVHKPKLTPLWLKWKSERSNCEGWLAGCMIVLHPSVVSPVSPNKIQISSLLTALSRLHSYTCWGRPVEIIIIKTEKYLSSCCWLGGITTLSLHATVISKNYYFRPAGLSGHLWEHELRAILRLSLLILIGHHGSSRRQLSV